MAAIVVVAYMALMMVNRRIADQQREQQRQVRRQLTVEVPGN
jgi:hypothetical protein